MLAVSELQCNHHSRKNYFVVVVVVVLLVISLAYLRVLPCNSCLCPEDEPNSLSSLRNIPPIPGQASLRRLSWRGTGSRPQFCGSPVSAGNESESASHSTRDVNGGEEGKGTEDTEPGSVGIRTPCSISRNFRKAWRCTQRRKQGKVQRLQHELQEAHDMLDKTFVAAHESAARVREVWLRLN